MATTVNILQSLIPISQFNKGQASKIFDRLQAEKELIVLKNNQASAVILAPDEYSRLTEIEENYYLLLEANRRLSENGDKATVSMEVVMADLGISETDLADVEDMESRQAIRVVYKVERVDGIMKVIVVSARTDEQVYKEVAKRRGKYDM